LPGGELRLRVSPNPWAGSARPHRVRQPADTTRSASWRRTCKRLSAMTRFDRTWEPLAIVLIAVIVLIATC
jgi:hypothetical protein